MYPCETLRRQHCHWQRLHCIVFAFTILENSTGSVDGIHPIAPFRDSEKYELVKLALADLIDEMKDTDVITVHGETFRIIYSACRGNPARCHLKRSEIDASI